ncbi:hypothetical protein ACRRTK_021518 [Alexandromys fortis]
MWFLYDESPRNSTGINGWNGIPDDKTITVLTDVHTSSQTQQWHINNKHKLSYQLCLRRQHIGLTQPWIFSQFQHTPLAVQTTSFRVPQHMDFRTTCEEERTVTIRRQTVGGFGLSIKRSFRDCFSSEMQFCRYTSHYCLPGCKQKPVCNTLCETGNFLPLQINGINVRKCRHEEVVQVLRNAGEEVTLTVSFLKRAPAFLKLPLNEDCACAPSDQSSGTSSPLCDSGLHLNYHPNNTDTLSCSSWPTSPGLRWEKRWCDLRLIPLLHARFSQYLPGTDLSRQNAFQVVAVDGVCSGIIQCLSTEDCMDWLQAIAANISSLTKHNIVYMGWCEAREQESLQDRVYTPVFLALRGSCLYRFPSPPDSDLLDRRKHCFTMQSECGEDFYFSVELESDLAQWERAFQTATFLEVERIQCKTYACVLESHLMGLTIDFSSGFICYDAATKRTTELKEHKHAGIKLPIAMTHLPLLPKSQEHFYTQDILCCINVQSNDEGRKAFILQPG